MHVPELSEALKRVAGELGVGDGIEPRLDRPKEAAHGDLATNLAMVLAGRLRRKPREVATEIVDRLVLDTLPVERAEIAGPGFINFSLSADYLRERLRGLARTGTEFGRQTWGRGHRVNVEFVSANPTGPLHVGHGRGAAVGDTLARLLEFSGHEVHREFYVNDAGAQIEKLLASVEARCRELQGGEARLPEGGYHGEYVVELARDLLAELVDRLAGDWSGDDRDLVRSIVLDRMIAEQQEDLRTLRVEFDEFWRESLLYASRQIDSTLAELEQRGLLYAREGARWLRTTDFGDDKDRVLVKSDGSFTYFLPDISYHRDKAQRGFSMAIDVWGADHHGYVPRMTAAMQALGLRPDFFEAVIVQLVRVERGGEEVKFSKRAGDFVTLRDLVDEVGPDVARYFFLDRGPQQQMVFDLDLAKERSEKNPVFKVQYAHARIRSVYRRGGIDPEDIDLDAELSPLERPEELDLIKTLLDFPETAESAARDREPHRVTAYLENLAGQLNSWYHAGTRDSSLRILGVDERVMKARLTLARGAEIVLKNGLGLLGITAPERM